MNIQRDADEWLEAGQRAVMLVTSAIHHPHATVNALGETVDLMKGMTPCEMALTVTWLTRLAAESLVGEQAGDRPQALNVLREIGLELEEAFVYNASPT